MTVHTHLEALPQRRTVAPTVMTRRPGMPAAGQGVSPLVLLSLQRSAGNAAVVGRLARIGQPAARVGPRMPVVQRCGPIPCDCSPDERAEYEAHHGGSGSVRDHGDKTEESAVQRSAQPDRPLVSNLGHAPIQGAEGGGQGGRSDLIGRSEEAQRPAGAGPRIVQRHLGVDTFREKPRLESAELGSVAELQVAASSAASALEVGKSSGSGVRAMQQALSSKGFAAPATGTFDAATQSAVARFQAAHGIPFPTGRQAGPKTLSTLDDHFLAKKPLPPPKPECSQYEPDEREQSRRTPGRSRELGTFGKELELFNFAAGDERLKSPEHQQALKAFIAKFSLFDPCTDFKVSKIIGFTDGVDREELNDRLRLDRANTVAGFLQTNGVPDAPDGVSADPATYDPGCNPGDRAQARRVSIRLVKRDKSETENCRDKPKPIPPPQGCKKDQTSQDWSLLSTAAGSVANIGAAATFNYILADTSPGGCKHILEFTGIGLGGGKSFPATVGLSGATPFKIKGGAIRPADFTRSGRVVLAEGGLGLGFGFQFARFTGLSTDPEPVDLSGVQLSAGADAMVLFGAWTLLPL